IASFRDDFLCKRNRLFVVLSQQRPTEAKHLRSLSSALVAYPYFPGNDLRIIPQLSSRSSRAIVLQPMSRNIPTANPQPISTGQAVLSDFGKSRTQNIPLGQQFFQCLCAAALGLASYFFVSHFFLQSV